jgi:hypothetical protein
MYWSVRYIFGVHVPVRRGKRQFPVGKAVVVEALVEVHSPLAVFWNVYFIKTCVCAAPEIVSPGFIYSINGFVFSFQPVAET